MGGGPIVWHLTDVALASSLRPYEAEILRLCRKVAASADDPILRNQAIAELKEAIQTEQNSLKSVINSRVATYREVFTYPF